MEDADLIDDNLFSDKMKINLHILDALMLNVVLVDRYTTLILLQ
jgi:hypothetical protein